MATSGAWSAPHVASTFSERVAMMNVKREDSALWWREARKCAVEIE
jgi:hypothetical protein